MSLMCCF